ncbi:MAG: hypothetical protein ACE5HY_02645 [Candidatus Hydrothermarchaeales archaeon]
MNTVSWYCMIRNIVGLKLFGALPSWLWKRAVRVMTVLRCRSPSPKLPSLFHLSQLSIVKHQPGRGRKVWARMRDGRVVHLRETKYTYLLVRYVLEPWQDPNLVKGIRL